MIFFLSGILLKFGKFWNFAGEECGFGISRIMAPCDSYPV